jgi:hypothetical protein
MWLRVEIEGFLIGEARPFGGHCAAIPLLQKVSIKAAN